MGGDFTIGERLRIVRRGAKALRKAALSKAHPRAVECMPLLGSALPGREGGNCLCLPAFGAYNPIAQRTRRHHHF